MSRLTRLALSLALLSLAAGCSHTFRIERTRPPVFQLNTTQKISLQVDKDGNPSSATTVLDTAIGVTQGQVLNKWLAVEPVRNEFNASLRGSGYAVVDRFPELIIRVRPTSWTYQLEEKPKDLNALRSGSGRLDARIEIVEAANPSNVLYGDSYWATASAENAGEPEAMARAAQRMAGAFIADLRPYRVSVRVELDDDDPIVEPGLELCEEGQFDAAYSFFADTVARSPRSAPALYNYGVLAESRGSYDEAENVLMRAIELAQKPLYYTALERVRLSRRDAQALQSP